MDRSVASQIRMVDLRRHPLQAALFSELRDAEVALRVDDLRRTGQRHEIEILPDNTIVCGDQWVRAAKLLAWEDIYAVTLDVTSDEDIERRLVRDNLSSRQVGPVSLARVFRHLKDRARNERRGGPNCELRDHVARLLRPGPKGRTLERYVRILQAPREIQDAVDHQSMPRSLAEQALKLAKPDLARIASEIRAGRNPVEVVSAVLRDKAPRGLDDARRDYGRLLRALGKTTPILAAHCAKLAGQGMDPEDAAIILRRAVQQLRRLEKAELQVMQRRRARIAQFAAKFRRSR
jgi:ParB-like chromosome segregation protein Spo0J